MAQAPEEHLRRDARVKPGATWSFDSGRSKRTTLGSLGQTMVSCRRRRAPSSEVPGLLMGDGCLCEYMSRGHHGIVAGASVVLTYFAKGAASLVG